MKSLKICLILKKKKNEIWWFFFCNNFVPIGGSAYRYVKNLRNDEAGSDLIHGI